MAVKTPQTIGEHLRNRRLTLHLLQADVATRLGVDIASVRNWECGVCQPMTRFLPRIIDFLGYEPTPEPTPISARCRHLRQRLGLTQEQLAKALDVAAVSIWRWESGRLNLPTEKLLALEKLILDRAKSRRVNNAKSAKPGADYSPMIFTNTRLRRRPSNSP